MLGVLIQEHAALVSSSLTSLYCGSGGDTQYHNAKQTVESLHTCAGSTRIRSLVKLHQDTHLMQLTRFGRHVKDAASLASHLT